MAISRTQKVTILDRLTSDVSSQKAVVLLTSRDAKSTINSVTNYQFRKACRDQGVVVEVVKNTLIQKTFPSISEKLVGQTFLAYLEDKEAGDEVTTPKIVVKHVSKEFNDYFNIVGSVVGGEFYDSSATDRLAKVPSFNDSMAMIAGSLNQITAKIAIAVKEIPASVARGVKAAKSE